MEILTDRQIESVNEIRKEFSDEVANVYKHELELQMLWIENVALRLVLCQKK